VQVREADPLKSMSPVLGTRKAFTTLSLRRISGLNGNGDFGLNTLILGFPGTGAPILAQQVVAGIAAKDFYLGYFGLGPEPTNLTALNNSR
jgi:hypothetical protein